MIVVNIYRVYRRGDRGMWRLFFHYVPLVGTCLVFFFFKLGIKRERVVFLL